MALQYVEPGAKRSVVMAYRLGESQPTETFHLRGLAPQSFYRVRLDGEAKGRRPALRVPRGAELAAGFPVSLCDSWRAAVVELEAIEPTSVQAGKP